MWCHLIFFHCCSPQCLLHSTAWRLYLQICVQIYDVTILFPSLLSYFFCFAGSLFSPHTISSLCVNVWHFLVIEISFDTSFFWAGHREEDEKSIFQWQMMEPRTDKKQLDFFVYDKWWCLALMLNNILPKKEYNGREFMIRSDSKAASTARDDEFNERGWCSDSRGDSRKGPSINGVI